MPWHVEQGIVPFQKDHSARARCCEARICCDILRRMSKRGRVICTGRGSNFTFKLFFFLSFQFEKWWLHLICMSKRLSLTFSKEVLRVPKMRHFLCFLWNGAAPPLPLVLPLFFFLTLIETCALLLRVVCGGSAGCLPPIPLFFFPSFSCVWIEITSSNMSDESSRHPSFLHPFSLPFSTC